MDIAARRSKLETAGLVVLDEAWGELDVETIDVWKPMITGQYTPCSAVPFQPQNAHSRKVDREWERLAQQVGVFGPGGDFLISVAGAGAGSIGWAHVRRTDEMRMAQHLGQYRGEPEFVTLSMDGRIGCGVTTEEYEVWVVPFSRSHSDPDTTVEYVRIRP